MQRQAMVVGSRAAWHHYRFERAKQSAAGVQIVTVQGLAERLAGGFLRNVNRDELLSAATEALQAEKGSLSKLQALADLPGTAKALCDTLATAWESALELSRYRQNPRCSDLLRLEAAIVSRLPASALTPTRLVSAALKRIDLAERSIGPLRVKGVYALRPCWRPLFVALAKRVHITWERFGELDGWLDGTGIQVTGLVANEPACSAVVCANPAHEVIEALRWARELVVKGHAKPHEITIATTSADVFDDHMRVLRAGCDLPLYFAEGQTALSTHEGQQAAALAELVLGGISQDRVLRAVRFLQREDTELKGLPGGWDRKITSSAPLLRVEHWEYELERLKKVENIELPSLLAFVRHVHQGPAEAPEIGKRWLRGRAKAIWERALVEGPASALPTTLERVRVPDEADPVASILWAPAGIACTVPGKFVRLIGLSSRGWPRTIQDDPLLPEHILGRRLAEFTAPQLDRLNFKILCTQASEVVLSRSRRDKEGRLLGASPLIPGGFVQEELRQSRLPLHAFSASDRLLARPDEFKQSAIAQSAQKCVENRRRGDITAHDGLVRAQHPVLLAALEQVQSATSLRMLLRNPLGFVWRYALHWKEPEDIEGEEPLFLNTLELGNLVHEILEKAVLQLDAEGGLFQASPQRRSEVIHSASERIALSWEAERPIPPGLIWEMTKKQACDLAVRALAYDYAVKEGLRSFVEVPFGAKDAQPSAKEPWDPTIPVELPKTSIRVRGRIDRLDLGSDHCFARVTDYKVSRKIPKDDPGLKEGKELQRAVYAFVVRALLPKVATVEAALLYPEEDACFVAVDPTVLMDNTVHYLNVAARLLRNGQALAGIEMEDRWEAMRFALPANAGASYLPRKVPARDEIFAELVPLWNK